MKKIISIILSIMFALTLAVPASAISTDTQILPYKTTYISLTRTPVYIASANGNEVPSGYINEGEIVDSNREEISGYCHFIYFTASDGNEYKINNNYLCGIRSDYNKSNYNKDIKEPAEKLMKEILSSKEKTVTVSAYYGDKIADYLALNYYHSLASETLSLNRPGVVINNGVVDIAKSRSNYYKATSIPGKIIEELDIEDKSELQKVYAIEEYIAFMLKYDNNYGNYGAIECLYKGKGICGDYASTFTALCDAAGIKSVIVIGSAKKGEGHAWNRVCIDENWYAVDVCFYDSISGSTKDTYKLFNDANRLVSTIIYNA